MKTKSRKKLDEDAGKIRRSEGTSYNAPAVEKTLDILEFLGDAPQGMSLTGIAEGLGRTKQEIFRILLCLQERGYLIRDAAQSYRLSTKLFEIGSRHSTTQALVARATPHLQLLASEVRNSCHLSIVVQDRMLAVARMDSDADVVLTVRIGATFEMHRGTSGRVALAYLNDEFRQEYWKRSGESAELIEQIEEQLREIREQGFAEIESLQMDGVTDCAAPILTGGGTLLGVLCVSHIRSKGESTTRPDIVRAVLECARKVSEEFGPADQR